MNTTVDPASAPARTRLGLFDSGLGGLSVLAAVRHQLPHVDLVYFADSAYAPYGERRDEEIQNRAQHIAHFLLHTQRCDGLVIACNSATAAAAPLLRDRHPHVPIVGVEPGVKPAVALSSNGRVGVMATDATLRSERMQRLLRDHAAGAVVTAQACTGLARAIENGELDSPEVLALIDQHTAPLRAAQVDTVVLGCTHYVFVAHHIQAAMGPTVRIIDTAEAVAKQVVKRLTETACCPTTVLGAHSEPNPQAATVDLWTSGDPVRLTHIAHRWLGLNSVAATALREDTPWPAPAPSRCAP